MTFPAFKDKKYYPEELDVSVGTIDSGSRTDLRYDNDVELVINEVAATPAFVVDLTFKRMLPPDNAKRFKIIIKGWYDGNAGHDVKLYAWNFDTEAWDPVTSDAKDLPDATEEETYTFYLEGHFDGMPQWGHDGKAIIRISHDSAGNVNHDLHLDQVYLGFDSKADFPVINPV